MLRILVRLYLVVALVVVATILVINYGFPYLFSGQYSAAVREGFSGERRLLSKQFSGVDASTHATLQQQLKAAAPGRYNWLTPAEQAALSPFVRDQLERYGIAWKPSGKKCCMVYATLDDGDVVGIASFNELPQLEATAYALVFLALLGAVCLWLVPHWRDLEKLRLAAARFGSGKLDARVGLSGRSSIRQLSNHFDRMADRIGKLIQSQRDMVNAVSHELRTPLSRLEFGLDSLQHHGRDTHDAATESRILGLRKDVEELEALVAELLTLGMVEHDRQAVFTETVALRPFLSEASGVTSEVLTLHKLDLSWQLDERLPQVVTESHSLARAYSNLVRNAVQHARGAIRVRTELQDPEHWNLIVEDDGNGIPEQERERVFDAFYRLDPSRNRATGGHGLGLAIVKKIVARHGGSIWVGRAELGGAMFVMTLPLRH